MSERFEARSDCPVIKRATRAFVDAFLQDVMPELTMVARGCGYALAVHGSLARDIDIIAIPWTKQADDADFLLQRLCGCLASKVGRAFAEKAWTEKAHGRRAKTIILPGMCPEIDFSVMPTTSTEGEDQ